MSASIFTVGHSNHSIEKFIGLLAAHGVTAIADVRSSPYSRYSPQFNREMLQAELKQAGIAYAFLGRELGARAEDPACYVDGRVSYDRLAQTPLFHEGLSRVVQGAAAQRIALMCAEKDPLTCHRTILVGRRLADRGVEVRHILDDGQIESHDAAVARLLSELDLDQPDLFRNREQRIADAYDRRGRDIAYVLADAEAAVGGPPA